MLSQRCKRKEFERALGKRQFSKCHNEKLFNGTITVCLFSNETKDDSINPKQIEIIKFRKKFLKEYVLAFICAKS